MGGIEPDEDGTAATYEQLKKTVAQVISESVRSSMNASEDEAAARLRSDLLERAGATFSERQCLQMVRDLRSGNDVNIELR